MKSYNEMADDVLRRVEEYTENQKRKRKAVMRIAPIAACLCIAAIVGFSVLRVGAVPLSPLQTTENSTNTNIGNWPSNYVPDRNGVKMIASYNDGINENDLCYIIPEDGEIIFSQRLMGAIEEYGDSVLYIVNVDVFSNGAHLEADSKQVAAVREQFAQDDHIVALETYFDGRENHYYFTLHAKLNELTEFNPNENYGYRLSLYEERITY